MINMLNTCGVELHQKLPVFQHKQLLQIYLNLNHYSDLTDILKCHKFSRSNGKWQITYLEALGLFFRLFIPFMVISDLEFIGHTKHIHFKINPKSCMLLSFFIQRLFQ